MRTIVVGSLIVVGIIHLLPVVGVLGAPRLEAMYGIAIGDEGTTLLLRHRAVLFGLLGTFMVAAVFVPKLRTSAWIAGAVSVASFLGLAWAAGDTAPQIGRVVTADIVAAVALVIGAAAHAWQRRSQATESRP